MALGPFNSQEQKSHYCLKKEQNSLLTAEEFLRNERNRERVKERKDLHLKYDCEGCKTIYNEVETECKDCPWRVDNFHVHDNKKVIWANFKRVSYLVAYRKYEQFNKEDREYLRIASTKQSPFITALLDNNFKHAKFLASVGFSLATRVYMKLKHDRKCYLVKWNSKWSKQFLGEKRFNFLQELADGQKLAFWYLKKVLPKDIINMVKSLA